MKYIYDSNRILQLFCNNHWFDFDHCLNEFKTRTGKWMKRVVSKPGKVNKNIDNHRKIVHDFEAYYFNRYSPKWNAYNP